MAIRKILKEWLGFRTEIKAPPDTKAKFYLRYGSELIGTLSAVDGYWRFEYSEDFRGNTLLRPIVEFPDLDKVYESQELWQFFASRIPSPERAEVGDIIEREHISEDDAVSLLRRFGRRTVANPFELEPA